MLETLSKIENEALAEFKRGLFQELKNDILFIRLFGSRARRDFQKDSDADLLIVLKQPSEERMNLIYDLAMSLTLKYGFYLSVKVFSEEEFNYYKKLKSRFVTNVLKEGIDL